MSVTSVGIVISNFFKIIKIKELYSCDSFLVNIKHTLPQGVPWFLIDSPTPKTMHTKPYFNSKQTLENVSVTELKWYPHHMSLLILFIMLHIHCQMNKSSITCHHSRTSCIPECYYLLL